MVTLKIKTINKEKEEKELISRIKFFLTVYGNLTAKALKKTYLKNRKKYPLKFKKFKEYQIHDET